MNGVVSQKLGLGILIDEDAVFVLDCSDAQPRAIHRSQIHRAVAGTQDLEYFERCDERFIRDTLARRETEETALRYALYSLDPSLETSTRQRAAVLVEDSINTGMYEHLEGIFCAAPFPDSADPTGAVQAASQAEEFQRLLRDLVKLQPVIRRNRHAWDAIPDDFFGESSREWLTVVAVRQGVFAAVAHDVGTLTGLSPPLNYRGASVILTAWAERIAEAATGAGAESALQADPGVAVSGQENRSENDHRTTTAGDSDTTSYAGSARIVDCIGKGSFHSVWQCVDDAGRLYAKKILNPNVSPAVTRRFRTEARLLSRLQHPGVVRIVANNLDNNPPSFLMPFYTSSLKDRLSEFAGDTDRALDFFVSVLRGVECIHRQGIIHRDLKPSNILINSDTDIVISDFGLGVAPWEGDTRITEEYGVLGTLLYMPPEQLRSSRHADQRSDIYSLGRILHEMLVGELPRGPELVDELGDVDPQVSLLVQWCTAADPSDRFQSVAELRNACMRVLAGLPARSDAEELELLCRGSAAHTPRLLDIIKKHKTDRSLSRHVASEATLGVLASLFARDQQAVRELMTTMVDVTLGDRLSPETALNMASRCQELFVSIRDPEVRATLLGFVVEVAAELDQGPLYTIVSMMIRNSLATTEEVAIGARLNKVDRQGRLRVLSRVESENPEISQKTRRLFGSS